MAGKATAIDPGANTVKALSLKDGKHGLALTGFAAFARKEAAQGLARCGQPLKDVVCGIAGRDMTLRYSQVPPSPDWQLRNLMDLEIQDLSEQSGGELSADYNLLPIEDEEGGMETVLLALARDEALDRVAEMVQSAGGRVAGHVPNCIALYNAFLRCGPVEEDATVALVNIGYETTDIAIVRGVDLLFVRNLSSGGKVFDDAIAAAFNVRPKKAEQLKRELLDVDPQSRGRYASGQAEKVTTAAGGAGSAIVGAIQSSVAFCRQQTRQADLQLDKILLSGGTARLRGVRGMLREALRCPAELFDPFENIDTSALSPVEHEQLDKMRLEAVVALGLAATEVDDSLYQLEILPESVKRRRNFLQRTIYNVGAAVIGVALIGLFAAGEKQRVESAELAYRSVKRQQTRVVGTHTAAEEQALENARTGALVEYLAERAIPLDGLVLTLRALAECMPAEFWMRSLEVRMQSMQGSAAGDQRPVVVLEGSGKDVTGRGVDDAYARFLSDFKRYDFEDVKPMVVPQSQSDGQGGRTFRWTIDYRPPPPEDGAGEPGAEGR